MENEIKTEVNSEVVGMRVVLNVVTVVRVANGGQLSGGVNSGIMATSGLPNRRATPKSNSVRGDFKKLIQSEYRS